jgi:putative hydrolase of the HAD superfamily
MKDVEALLFDLGGVVVDVNFARVTQRWAEHAGHDPAALARRYTHDEAYARHERGEIPIATYFESLRHSLGIDIPDSQFLDGWNAIFGGVIPGVSPLLERAAQRMPIYLFSNTNPAHETFWRREYSGALKPFRTVFVSSAIGLRKPEREAFLHVAKEIGVAPQKILFFDDSADNVAGAKAAGLQAVHVRSNDDVAAALAPFLAPAE